MPRFTYVGVKDIGDEDYESTIFIHISGSGTYGYVVAARPHRDEFFRRWKSNPKKNEVVDWLEKVCRMYYTPRDTYVETATGIERDRRGRIVKMRKPVQLGLFE